MTIDILTAQQNILSKTEGMVGVHGVGIDSNNNSINIYISTKEAKRNVLSITGIYPYGYDLNFIYTNPITSF